jgi:hypothetical protein
VTSFFGAAIPNKSKEPTISNDTTFLFSVVFLSIKYTSLGNSAEGSGVPYGFTLLGKFVASRNLLRVRLRVTFAPERSENAVV